MALWLLIKGLPFHTTKTKTLYQPKELLTFNDNFPAEKAYRPSESIFYSAFTETGATQTMKTYQMAEPKLLNNKASLGEI